MGENGNGSGLSRDPVTGFFVKGTKGGPGNPFSKRLHELRQSVIDATSPEDVKAVIGKLLELAKSGDVQAARVWLEYTVGKPAQSLEVSGLGGQPLGMDITAVTNLVLVALAKYPAARAEIITALENAKRADS